MATLIKADGTETELKPAKKSLSLDELQAAVGGWIEQIRLGRDVMLVNEEGTMRELPINEKASMRAGTTIRGDVVLCKNGKMK